MTKISKSGIAPHQQIKSEHLLRIINALDGTNPNTNIEVSGSVTASYFIGDGSQLTNIPTGSGGGSQDLQSVLDSGNESTTILRVIEEGASTEIYAGGINCVNSIGIVTLGSIDEDLMGTNNNTTGQNLLILSDRAIGDRNTFRFPPNKPSGDHIIATLDDIPTGGTQDLQSVLTQGNSTTLDFYKEWDPGLTTLKAGVLPLINIPVPFIGASIDLDDGRYMKAGFMPATGVTMAVQTNMNDNLELTTAKSLFFKFPIDKPAAGEATYILATLDDILNINLDSRVYANNAAAITGGLVVKDLYRTATGEVRIVI